MGTEEMEKRGNHISSEDISNYSRLNHSKEILSNRIIFLKSQFNRISEFIFVLNNEHDIIYANKFLLEELKYNESEILTKSLIQIINASNESVEEMLKVAKERRWSGKVRSIRKDNTSSIMSFEVSAILDEGNVLCGFECRGKKGVGLFEEGTNFLNVIEELKAELKFIPDVLIRADSDGLIIDFVCFELAENNFQSNLKSKIKLGDFFPSDIGHQLNSSVKNIIHTNDSEKVEFQLKLNNELEIFKAKISPSLDNKFNIFIRNVSKHRNNESEVLKFKKAVESSEEIIFISDKDGLITYINPAFTKTYGFEKDEVVGKETPRIIKSGLIKDDYYNEFWKTLLKKRGIKGEIVNKTKDGREIFIEETTDPIIDERENIVGFLSIQRDITERKKSEEALKYSEMKFRSIWEKSDDGMRLTDVNGMIISVNNSFCRLVGMKESDLIGKPFYIIYDDDKIENERKLVKYKELFDKKNLIPTRFSRYSLKNGKTVFFNVSYAFVEEKIGKPLTLSIFRDLTDYKKAEEDLRNSEKLAAVGRMTAYLSHEIKNPLASIKNYLNLLFETDELSEKIKRPLGLVLDEVKRLNKLMKDVLEFSRPINLINIQLDIKTVIEKVKESVSQKLIAKNILLKNNVKEIKITGDYITLQSVFLNLIENSIDAIANDGVIEIWAESEKDNYSVYIKDNGHGVDRNDKIFEPFFTTKSYGTGLGLSIIKKIMELHNGDIQLVSSRPGETIFKIFFLNNFVYGKNSNN